MDEDGPSWGDLEPGWRIMRRIAAVAAEEVKALGGEPEDVVAFIRLTALILEDQLKEHKSAQEGEKHD